MTDQKVPKQGNNNGGIVNPVVAAVAGAVVGAGIAITGVALSDKKNRDNMLKSAATIKENVVEFVENAQKQAETKKIELDKKLAKDKKILKKVVGSAKNSLHKTTKEVNNALKSL
ncbi:MAG: hypothetical protein Q7R95_07965 [bacterium]|nr:hypothetical protein [bacterium]